jgi:hypothetical protein
MKTSTLSLILLCQFILACSYSAGVRTDNNQKEFDPTDADSVKIFSGNQIEHQYIIGEVFAYHDLCESPDCVTHLLKKEAAQLGANAIMGVQYEYDYDHASIEIKARGQAIYISPLQNKDSILIQ